jgi:hypothetical protein
LVPKSLQLEFSGLPDPGKSLIFKHSVVAIWPEGKVMDCLEISGLLTSAQSAKLGVEKIIH